MAKITYIDKNKDGVGEETIYRDTDANEVKASVNALYDDKVDKSAGKSLVLDTEIAKIHAAGSDNQDLSGLAPLAPAADLTFTFQANKTLVFSQPTYRDEYPAMVIPASGAAAPDEVAHTIGGVLRTLRGFDGGNTQEILSGSFEIPHDYMIGQPIEVHVHWRPATTGTGTVIWYFDYEYSPPNAAPIAQVTMQVEATLGADRQYYHLLSTLGNMPQPATPFAIGGKIGFNLRRTPTTDTFTGDALLEQISLHVPCDTAGSRQIYVK